MNDKIQMDDPRHPLHGLQPADSTIFVIADERFGETSIYAEKELERVILECACLLYTSPSPRDATLSRMPSSA